MAKEQKKKKGKKKRKEKKRKKGKKTEEKKKDMAALTFPLLANSCVCGADYITLAATRRDSDFRDFQRLLLSR